MDNKLSRKLDSMEYDGLISGLTPEVKVKGGTVAKGTETVTLVRGTILAKSTTGKLSILGSAAGTGDTLTPDCILADDVEVGTVEDVNVAVYDMGCFNPEKLTVKGGYTITEADKDKLRERGIYLVAASN